MTQPKYATPNKVMSVAPVNVVVVQYSDGAGNVTYEFMYLIGDTAYVDPGNGANFAKNLHAVRPVLNDQVMALVKANTPSRVDTDLAAAAVTTAAEFNNGVDV